MTRDIRQTRFEVKSVNAKTGLILGRASVYGVIDSYNDVVMRGAFTNTLAAKRNEIVVLSQHDPSMPIGRATLTDAADALHASIRLELRLQSAQDMLVCVDSGLIDGISIGYEVVKDSWVGGVRQLHEINLWEISLVTFPANAAARVTDVKQATSTDHAMESLITSVRETTHDIRARQLQTRLDAVNDRLQRIYDSLI